MVERLNKDKRNHLIRNIVRNPVVIQYRMNCIQKYIQKYNRQQRVVAVLKGLHNNIYLFLYASRNKMLYFLLGVKRLQLRKTCIRTVITHSIRPWKGIRLICPQLREEKNIERIIIKNLSLLNKYLLIAACIQGIWLPKNFKNANRCYRQRV